MSIQIVQAEDIHIPELVPLLDAYRRFYKQPSDEMAAQQFLEERFRNKESVIFIALVEGKAAGFTQLYKSFSTVSLQPLLILNDLYVPAEYRNKGIGKALLLESQEYCRRKNYKGLGLETAIDNPAQKLYEQLGWEKDSHCFHYFWTVP
jgi:ribosomal protein S18 acetylase RimI-like enzyme